MGVFIYIIRDKNTGKVLFTGRETAATDFLGCGRKYVCQLATGQAKWSKKVSVKDLEVTRYWDDGPVRCVDCGAEIPDAGPLRERCDECRQKRKKKVRRAHHEKARLNSGENLVHYAVSQEEMQKDCIGCVYFSGGNYINRTCNYIFMEGHSRGDRYGEKCSKRKERKRK